MNYTTYTYPSVPAEILNILTEGWRADEFKAAIEATKELSKFHPCSLVIEAATTEAGIELRRNGYTIKSDTYNWLTINPPTRWAKEWLFIDRTPFPAALYGSDEWKEPTPNKVRVLSQKKVEGWISYMAARHQWLKVRNDAKDSKVAAFLAMLIEKGVEVRPSSMRGSHVKWGSLVKGGLEYTCEVDTNTGSISQKISVYYSTRNTLENFFSLTDNQYKQPEQ